MFNRSSVCFGAICFQRLSAIGMAYGESVVRSWHSLHPLQHFTAVPDVHLVLSYSYRMVNCEFLMEAVNMVPAVKVLSLMLSAGEHAFESCVFHLLRMSTGIRELNLELTEVLNTFSRKFLAHLAASVTSRRTGKPRISP